VVIISEILKNNGLAIEKSKIFVSPVYFCNVLSIQLTSDSHRKLHSLSAEIMTSTVDMKDDSRGRPIQKAKVKLMRIFS
jgi:hypothetical protein